MKGWHVDPGGFANGELVPLFKMILMNQKKETT
jgi:hypothetical protein